MARQGSAYDPLRREEAVYDREAVLGRDTSSVFPKEAEKAKKDKLETIKKAVGLDSSRFITESQVACTKAGILQIYYCISGALQSKSQCIALVVNWTCIPPKHIPTASQSSALMSYRSFYFSGWRTHWLNMSFWPL